MKAYDIHPDFLKYAGFKIPLSPATLRVMNFFLTRVFYSTNPGKGISETRREIAGYHGESVKLSIIEPTDSRELLPALVYFHGGAFALQAAPYIKRLLGRYALEAHCKVIFADYHLLPKAVFPIGLEDCFSAYRWVIDNTETLHIDPSRIAVGGDSAGGELAIGTCLLARERGIQMPCFQLLIYPTTDSRMQTGSMREFTDVPLWNSTLSAKIDKMYMPKNPAIPKWYASVMEAPTLQGLPGAYVEVADYDCLRDEGIEFAKRLRATGVSVELHQTKRTIHGYDIAEKNEIVKDTVRERINALKAAFGVKSYE
jgi:acetyl esterase/lipase